MKPSIGLSLSMTLSMGLAFGLALSGCSVSLNESDNKQKTQEALAYAFEGVNPDGSKCWTDPHAFPAGQKKAFCAALKDEKTNNNCAAWARRQRYLQHCGRDFPQVLPPVVEELRKNGVSVYVVDLGGAPTTGETSFSARLTRFWGVLENQRTEVLNRASLFRSITVTDRAQYRGGERSLELAVNFTEADLVRYFQILDRRVALAATAGVTLDFGIDIEPYAAPDFSRAEAVTAALENRASALKPMIPLVKTVVLGKSSRFALEDGELNLAGPSYDAELQAALGKLASFVSFAKFAAEKSLALGALKSTDSSVRMDLLHDDTTLLLKAFNALDQERAALEDLRNRGELSRLSFSQGASEFEFSSALLRVPLAEGALANVGAVMGALSTQFARSSELGVSVVRRQAYLDASFIECMKRLETKKELIKSKLSRINTIYLQNTSSSFSDGLLVIGSKGTAAELEDVLKKIP